MSELNDAPEGNAWKCPDCGKLATLGGNAAFHRDVAEHGEPSLVPFTAPESELTKLKAELAKLRDGWISVTERLPEAVGDDHESVFVFGRLAGVRANGLKHHMERHVGWRRDGRWLSEKTDNYGNYIELVDVSHYRELPAPPTDGRAE